LTAFAPRAAAIGAALAFLAAGAAWIAALYFILAGTFGDAAEAARWQALGALPPVAAGAALGYRLVRRRAEAAPQARLNSILAAADVVIWSVEARTFRLTYVNPGVARLTGYTDQALLAQPNLWQEMIVPEDRERVAGARRQAAHAGLFDCDYRIARPDGTLRWINDHGKAVHDGGHGPLRLDGVAADITERRVNEIVNEAINLVSGAFLFRRDPPELFGRIAGFLSDSLRFPIAAVGLYNPALERAECLGLAGGSGQAQALPGLAELAGAVSASGATWCERDIAQVADPRLRGLGELGGRSFLCLPLRVGEAVLGALLLADRSYRPDVDALAAPLRMVAHHLALELDRRRTAGILDHHSRSLRSLIDSLPVFVGITTPEGVVTDANRAALEVAGLAAGDVIGKPLEETYWWSYSTESQDRIRAALDRAAQGMDVRFTDRARVAEERFIAVDVAIVPVRDQDGRITHLIPSGVDTTQRSQGEETLRGELRLLELCFDAAEDGLALLAPDSGRCLRANASLGAALGWAPDELPGLTLAEITRIEATDAEARQWARLLRGEIKTYSLRRNCLRKDGAAMEIELRMDCRLGETGGAEAVLASFRRAGPAGKASAVRRDHGPKPQESPQ
jgi:PAS domain S-box-containing protein